MHDIEHRQAGRFPAVPPTHGTFYPDLAKIARQKQATLAVIERMPRRDSSKWKAIIFRTIGILFALLSLLICVVPFMAIAVVIKLTSPGPVFYRQARVGKGGKVFEMFKFRSMTVDAERNGPCWARVNDPRVTSIGAFLG